MLILGDNTDDKGTQLEALACSILRKLNYVNVTTNQIGSGGEEIDVMGEIELPTVGQPRRIRVLVECKAHKSPISLPDWLKFLGKVFTAKMTQRMDIHGCLIALSGANGNCTGAAAEFLEHSQIVELISGDRLHSTLTELFGLTNEVELATQVSALTDRTVIQMELAYYSARLFWFIRFHDRSFSLLANDGREINSPELNVLQQLVSASEDVTNFIELSAELKARRERFIARSLVISTAMINGGSTPLTSVCQGFSQEVTSVARAANELQGDGILTLHDEVATLADSSTPQFKSAVIRTLLEGAVVPSVLACESYLKLIDDDLLAEIRRTQGGLNLAEDDAQRLKTIVRMSPRALAAALKPIEMIVAHRNADNPISDIMNEMDVEYLFQTLYQRLEADFRTRELAEHFYDSIGVVEVEKQFTVRVKARNGVVVERDMRSRYRLAELDDSLTQGKRSIISILLANDQPEPWQEQLPEGRELA